jgi:hypothetical protein
MTDTSYGPTAQAALRIPAALVIPGDVLIVEAYVSLVSRVSVRDLSTGADLGVTYPASTVSEILELARNANQWPVLHIAGDVNVIRFPHELVSVLR